VTILAGLFGLGFFMRVFRVFAGENRCFFASGWKNAKKHDFIYSKYGLNGVL
jgi:hypothetical protein